MALRLGRHGGRLTMDLIRLEPRDEADRIFEDNRGLAVKCATKYHRPGSRVSFEDCLQIARLKLFEVARGIADGRLHPRGKISTYLHHCIMNELALNGRRESHHYAGRLPAAWESDDDEKQAKGVPEPAAPDRLKVVDRCEQAAWVLRQLLPRERRVLVLRFGLDGGGERSMQEIADELGVSRTRINQIYGRILMRRFSRTQGQKAA